MPNGPPSVLFVNNRRFDIVHSLGGRNASNRAGGKGRACGETTTKWKRRRDGDSGYSDAFKMDGGSCMEVFFDPCNMPNCIV